MQTWALPQELSSGCVQKLGEPDVDTTPADTAAFTLEDKLYFIRRVGSDGFKISHQPTMKKVVNDRRVSLDEESEIRPAMRMLIQKEFDREGTLSTQSTTSP